MKGRIGKDKMSKVAFEAAQLQNKAIAEEQDKFYKKQLIGKTKMLRRVLEFKQQQIDSGIVKEKDDSMIDFKRPIHMLKCDVEVVSLDLEKTIQALRACGLTDDEINKECAI
jgi:hypothetical protein